jgi:hypothetical protein
VRVHIEANFFVKVSRLDSPIEATHSITCLHSLYLYIALIHAYTVISLHVWVYVYTLFAQKYKTCFSRATFIYIACAIYIHILHTPQPYSTD